MQGSGVTTVITPCQHCDPVIGYGTGYWTDDMNQCYFVDPTPATAGIRYDVGERGRYRYRPRHGAFFR